MTEREMRDLVAKVLRRTVRKVVLPVSFGVGLALTGACNDSSTPLYAAPLPEAGMQDAGPSSEAGVLYGAPFEAGTVSDGGQASVEGGVLYGAPFEAGAVSDGGQASVEGGVLYGAPFEAGVKQDEGNPVPLYGASFPDQGTAQTDLGSGGTLYAAPFPG